jgi:hypothetical protein
LGPPEKNDDTYQEKVEAFQQALLKCSPHAIEQLEHYIQHGSMMEQKWAIEILFKTLEKELERHQEECREQAKTQEKEAAAKAKNQSASGPAGGPGKFNPPARATVQFEGLNFQQL